MRAQHFAESRPARVEVVGEDRRDARRGARARARWPAAPARRASDRGAPTRHACGSRLQTSMQACSTCAITKPGASCQRGVEVHVGARCASSVGGERALVGCKRRRGGAGNGEPLESMRRSWRAMPRRSAGAGAMLRFMRNRLAGIEPLLQRLQARVVRAIARGHALGLVLGQEVDVAAAGRVRRRRFEGLARPGRAPWSSSLRVRPAAVHVHDYVRIAADEGGGRGLHARHRTAELGDEDLAFRPRQAAPRRRSRRRARRCSAC